MTDNKTAFIESKMDEVKQQPSRLRQRVRSMTGNKTLMNVLPAAATFGVTLATLMVVKPRFVTKKKDKRVKVGRAILLSAAAAGLVVVLPRAIGYFKSRGSTQ